MWWTEWWIWGAFAIALVLLEVLAPAFIFLGFGIGAGIISLLLAVGGAPADLLSSSLGWLLSGFATISVISWVGLRSALGVTKTQVKTFDDDINEG